MSSTASASNSAAQPALASEPVFPDRLPVPPHLDPAAALAFRTPLHEHVLSADGKAAGVITMLGMMFTVLASFAGPLSDIVQGSPDLSRYAASALVLGFAALSLGAVIQ